MSVRGRAMKKKRKHNERRRRSHRPHQREIPDDFRAISLKNNKIFFYSFFDLPCKRTCHGKGRFTNILFRTTSSPKQQSHNLNSQHEQIFDVNETQQASNVSVTIIFSTTNETEASSDEIPSSQRSNCTGWFNNSDEHEEISKVIRIRRSRHGMKDLRSQISDPWKT